MPIVLEKSTCCLIGREHSQGSYIVMSKTDLIISVRQKPETLLKAFGLMPLMIMLARHICTCSNARTTCTMSIVIAGKIIQVSFVEATGIRKVEGGYG